MEETWKGDGSSVGAGFWVGRVSLVSILPILVEDKETLTFKLKKIQLWFTDWRTLNTLCQRVGRLTNE
jgi:hypothetical protein